MSETRKLTTIVVTDVVAFSRLTAADEELTLARLRALRSDLIDPLMAVYHGRIVKRTGDGSIVEFRSVVDAARCSIEVQNGMVERNAGLPPERQIRFRIGIHLGDVMEESDGDLMGDGVNIAARLQNICEPGAICISEPAYWQVKSRLDLAVTDLGNKELKNIPEPVHVFSLKVGKPAHAKPAPPPISVVAAPPPKRRSALIPLASGIAALIVIAAIGAWYFLLRPSANIAANAPAHLSIVVLPFQNLSGDEKQNYLADVITDQLTTYIARSFGKDSLVIARNTAMTFKGKAVDAKEIGKELGVRHVLEGSVQPTSNRIRVNAQLIDAESGSHLWADTFDTNKSDLLQAEDKIVTRLARSLNLEVMYSEAAKAERVHPANPDAEDLARRCLAAWYEYEFGREGEAGLSLCEQALALDPNNVDALTTLSWAKVARVGAAQSTDLKNDLMHADELVSRALQVDRNNARAHHIKAFILYQERRFDEGREEAERAIALDPSDVDARRISCEALYGKGQADKIASCVDAVIRLSPHDPSLWTVLLVKGAAHLMMGKYEAALETLRQSASFNPDYPLAQAYLAGTAALVGQDAEAHEALARYLSLPGTHAKTIAALKKQTASDNPTYLAMREHIYEGLRKAGMPEDEGPRLSIVVLPFENLSGDAKQDYLADVLTDELTTYISRIPGSFVIARNTAFTYKGKAFDAKQIGKELRVRYVLEGSVLPTDKRIRTNAQLIDTETGAHLWAEDFDTDKTDLLQTEDAIVTRLARTLQIQLVDIEAAKLRRAHPANPDAQELALRCEAAAFSYAPGNPKETTFGFCEQALALDQNNVLALAILSQKYVLPALSAQSVNRQADIQKADELASRALTLDPNGPDAHTAMSSVLMAKKEFDEARTEAQRAIALDPSSMNAYSYLCLVDLYTAQAKRLIECSDKALALSPRDPQQFLWLGSKGFGYFILGQDNLAIEWLKQSLALNPTALPALEYLTAALALTGRDAEAHETLVRAKSVSGARNFTIAALKQRPNGDSPSYFAMRERVYQGLRKAGMPEQ